MDEGCDVFYIAGSKGDTKVQKIQAIIPETEINIIEENDKNEFLLSEQIEDENILILSGSEKSVVSSLKEQISEFRILYMTRNYAIWGKPNSESYMHADKNAINRLESVPLGDVVEAELVEEAEDNSTDSTETEMNTDADEKETDMEELGEA